MKYDHLDWALPLLTPMSHTSAAKDTVYEHTFRPTMSSLAEQYGVDVSGKIAVDASGNAVLDYTVTGPDDAVSAYAAAVQKRLEEEELVIDEP